MSTMEELLAQAEAAELETAVEEQPYVYSDKYLKRTQYVSDNAPIDIIAKEIQSMDGEISVKGEAISQYVEFRLDRYYDGIDLLGMLFNIHYEKDSYGGENRPVNVRYNDTKMILGWAIPSAAVKESGILNMCIWATGNLYDDTYVWKTKPKSYTVNDGLTIAENIAEPDDNWYVQFVNELETKIQEFSGRIDDIVQTEENLSTDIQAINEKYDSITASVETAGQSAASAQLSERNAKESEESAYLYKEQTQQIAEQVKEEVTKVYKYQGSVPTYDDLPTENVSNGDVYNVESDGMNYAWDEANQKWDSLGIVIDLSKYSTTEQIELMLNQYVQKESGKGLFSGSYNDLSDKPNVNGIELFGNKTLDELGIASKTAFESLSENVSTNADGITNLNSNLVQLSYSDDSGSGNLFNGVICGKSNANFQNGVLTNTSTDSRTQFAFQIQVYSGSTLVLETPNVTATGNVRNSISLTIPSTSNVTFLRLKHNGSQKDIYIDIPFTKTGNFTISVYVSKNNPSTVGGLEIRDIQIEEGSVATSYEPYIPSVKMLAEENAQQDNNLSSLGKCKSLLKPILPTTTQNGVTCTKNSDGTYTLNGTATSKVTFYVNDANENIQNYVGKKLRLVGSPKGSGNTTYGVTAYIIPKTGSTIYHNDFGEGKTFTVTNNMQSVKLYIEVYEGQSLNNLVFKPMLTTNLDATYDDFVPYTGDGDTLTADVAKLKNDLGGLSFSVSDGTLSITDGTNTWTLPKTT